MRNEKNPNTITASLQKIIEPSLIVVGVVPLYLIGYDAAKDLLDNEVLSVINGIICAGITFPFSFQLLQREKESLPAQWKIADNTGKAFIILSSVIALTTAGIANCYYMTGNTGFKIIALLMPAIAARAIVSDWLLRANLAITALLTQQYKQSYQTFRLLDVFSNNLKFNSHCKESVNTSYGNEIQSAAIHVINESKNRTLSQNTKTSLKELIKDGHLINTEFGGWLFLKNALIFFLGSLAGYSMYSRLGPEAGACVYGSLLQNDFSDSKISCPITDTSLESIGHILGYATAVLQTGIVIFPMMKLFDIIRASSNNSYSCNSWMIYFASLLLGICRASISVFIEEQNNQGQESLGSEIFVAVVFFFYNFFSMAHLGPPTFKTIGKTIAQAGQGLWHWFHGVEESKKKPLLPENENDISVEATLQACQALQNQFLFHPFETATEYCSL